MASSGRCTKRKYLSRESAEMVIRAMRRTARNRKRGGYPLESYLCVYCGFWHVGHGRPLELRASFPAHIIRGPMPKEG